MSNSSESVSLEQTPTYAAATVIFVFVSISYALERGLHFLGKWLRKNRSKPLVVALQIMRDELMLLGFISILLTVFQSPVAGICVPISTTMLPCPVTAVSKENGTSKLTSAHDARDHASPLERISRGLSYLVTSNEDNIRRIPGGISIPPRRSMAVSSGSACPTGMSFVSSEGVHQLHLFIFILAMTHLIYSCITLLLALYKIHRWKVWETEAQQMAEQCQALTLQERIRLMKMKRVSTFVRRHEATVPALPLHIINQGLSLAGIRKEGINELESRASHWLTSFFAQFWNSVTRAEYLTLRMAFISNHNAGYKFDFHAYLVRSMESDFTFVIGTKFTLWLWVVLCFIMNVSGWNFLFWVDFIPLVLALLVGTKLEHIMATLAQETSDAPALCVGSSIKARDELFWFNKPKLLLHILHFVIFQNSLELATIFWTLVVFGSGSCLFGSTSLVIVRLVLSLLIQTLCSYITLPLYCLVTQMGSHYKGTIFSDHVQGKLSAWAARHKKRSSKALMAAISEPQAEAAPLAQSSAAEKPASLKSKLLGALSASRGTGGGSVSEISMESMEGRTNGDETIREEADSDMEDYEDERNGGSSQP